MALFLGTIENKVDSKGRVSVPADFRNVLKGDDFQGVILFHSFTDKCIEGFTMSRMEQMADATDNLDLFGEENQNLNSLIFSDARQLSFDITGRIVIPSDLLEFAGIKDKALFVGRGKTFQIWNEDDFYKSQEDVRNKAQKTRPSLSFKRD
ncbi:division/cell wall cluster transcriptional repressor MraZ [bacterium]|nr:division/cell wall cluster transcriptional repressor MraZ [bacterium]